MSSYAEGSGLVIETVQLDGAAQKRSKKNVDRLGYKAIVVIVT